MKKCIFFLVTTLFLCSCSKITCETVNTDSISCDVVVYSPDIIRVVKYPIGTDGAKNKTSWSAIMEPQPTSVKRSEDSNNVTISTENISVIIDKPTANITYCDARTGKVLLVESETSFVKRPKGDVDEDKYKVSQAWKIDKDEFLYGMGQRQDSDLCLRGKEIHLWQDNMYIYIPFFCSNKGYGVFWDNSGMSDFSDNSERTLISSEVANCTDCYFMYGDGSIDSVIAAERKLGGKSIMFPLWAHGFWQCRERYHSTWELNQALHTYRQMGVPLDCIVQDWQYWGPNSNWNSMKFDNPAYKNADSMIAYVKENNAHIAISIWPNFGPDTKQYSELDSIGALYPFSTWPRNAGAKLYDAFNADARAIYWKHLKSLVDSGVDALWSDYTEPEQLDEKEGDSDYLTSSGSWRGLKNVYCLVTNKGIYDSFRAQNYGKRSVQLTRSGAFGLQHYASFSWSGDIRGTWDVFRRQISSGLDYTICGIPYWTTDIGGFFNGFYRNGTNNPAFQELQVRWMQWSVFVPVMRNHNSSPYATEIYRFGEPGQWQFDEQLNAIKLRYRLLPYIYSLAGMSVQNDGMFMRPLVMDFMSDRKALGLSDEYMFGPSFLVHPITEPVLTSLNDKNEGEFTGLKSSSFTTYLPSGTGWYDFHNGEYVDGGVDYTREYDITQIPVFVKAGSIILYGQDVQYSSEKPWDNLDVVVYPGADGEFTLYEDAGDGYEYENGEFTTIKFTWDDTNKKLNIGQRNGSYDGMLKNRKFNVKIYGEDNSQVIEYDGNAVSM